MLSSSPHAFFRQQARDVARSVDKGIRNAPGGDVNEMQLVINVYIGEDKIDATFEKHYQRRELGLAVV